MKINFNSLRVLKPYRILYINFYIEMKSLIQKRVTLTPQSDILNQVFTEGSQNTQKIHQTLEYYRSTVSLE